VFFRSAAKIYDQSGLSDKTVRIEQRGDPIAEVPPKSMGYAHVGREINLGAEVGATHSGDAYRNIAKNVNDGHVVNADGPESTQISDYSIYSYMCAVMSAKGNLLRRVRDVVRSMISSFDVGSNDSRLPNTPNSSNLSNTHKHDDESHDGGRN